MEIVLSKEDGTEFARFADAEELARWAVRVCVVADNEIERLKDNAASLRTQRDYLMGIYIVYSLLIYKTYFPHKIILDSLT